MAYDFTTAANSLDEFWMPFTPVRYFKKSPRMVVKAEGMYYYDAEGKEIIDGIAGLWCVNAGHGNPKVKEAIKAQLDTLDYVSFFQYGNPTAFKAASRLCAAMPKDFGHVFFSNSGSEAVETALKIALNYHRLKGEGTRRILIGRERSYHGVNFGGISVGGITPNRAYFGQLLPNIDHIPHTYNLEKNAFSKGQPKWGAHLADDLERRILLHDPKNVAAVIMEPVAGATGVLPPPEGYLKKVAEICKKYGVLLIFDEVITGFGRFGAISSADYFGVQPDIITMAKGITNGTIPMGATFVTNEIHDAFMKGPEHVIELMHGYTYSGHPVAAAAAIGTLDAMQDGKIWENAQKMAKPFEDAVHSLKNKPRVIDIRNCGILAAIELEAGPKDDFFKHCREASWELFHRGAMVRFGGGGANLYLCPPLILNQNHIDRLVTLVGEVLTAQAQKKVA
jgi:beta-alanine--pyruvate transaminase